MSVFKKSIDQILKSIEKLMFGLLTAITVLFSSIVPAKAYRLPEVADISYEVPSEGIVLLENPEIEKGKYVLPFNNQETVSVFGRTQIDYIKCGNGSGGMLTSDHVVNLIDGLRNNKSVKIN